MTTKITFAILVLVCYIINCHFTYAFIAEYAHLRKKYQYNKMGNHDEDFGDGRSGILRLQPV